MLNVFFHLPIVLLYVRTGAEEVFDALMLNAPTLSGLREAVSETLTHMHAYNYPTWSPRCCLPVNTYLHIHARTVLNFTRTIRYVLSLKYVVFLSAGDHANCCLIFLSSGFRKVRYAKRHHWENLQEMQERVSYFGMPNALLLYNWLNTPVGWKEFLWHRRSA